MQAVTAMRASAKRKLTETFNCRFLQRDLAISDCMDQYVNANALNIRNSPCFKCAHGLKTRMEFAGE